ncbi:hypothetical protein BHE74_00018519, partial [Ensete ventricosum]
KGARVSHRGRLPTSTPPPHPGSHRVLLKSLHYFLNPSLISLPAPFRNEKDFPSSQFRVLFLLSRSSALSSDRSIASCHRNLTLDCRYSDRSVLLQKVRFFSPFFLGACLLFRSEMVFVC